MWMPDLKFHAYQGMNISILENKLTIVSNSTTPVDTQAAADLCVSLFARFVLKSPAKPVLARGQL